MIPQIDVNELKQRLDAGHPVYLLDVRNDDEYAYCHLPNSVLIPLPELPARVDEVNPPDDALVVVYCHHGVRSLHGANVLIRAGLHNIASLAGGIDAWSLLIDPAVPRY
jgi:rhodanese-related sulfurtransferase